MVELHPLIQLIDEMDLLGPENWNRRHVLLTDAVSPQSFVSERDVLRILDQPLLRSPYFSVVKEGVWASPDLITQERSIGGVTTSGFANAEGIRDAMALGATVKLNQMEDWHRPTRDLVQQLESRTPSEVKAYVFRTPSENTGMRPHRDGSHVLAIQLSGSKDWRLYGEPGEADARAGLVDVDVDKPSYKFTMHPGDVLYLPHGYVHAPSATDENSLHITLTMTEPSPLDLLQGLASSLHSHRPRLWKEWPRLRNEDRVAAVIEVLESKLMTEDDHELVGAALATMRNRTQK